MPEADTTTTTQSDAVAGDVVRPLIGADADTEGDQVTDAAAADDTADDASSKDDVSAGAPDEYTDFEIPEGIPTTEQDITNANTLFKELGLTQEQAQKLIDFEVSRTGEATASQQQQVAARLNEINTEHIQAVKDDPDMGGVDYMTNVKIAQSAILHFGGEDLQKALVEHHMASHPALVKAWWVVGKAQAEDTVRPGAKATLQREPRSHAQILYDQRT